jgi:hypothetical protein
LGDVDGLSDGDGVGLGDGSSDGVPTGEGNVVEDVADGEVVIVGVGVGRGRGANECAGTPASASRMKAAQICAGNDPPTTWVPLTSVIGLLVLGYPFHTTAARSGV